MQSQPLQHFFCVAGQLFVLFIRIFRPRELDQFHLLELMLADDAAHVLAVRSGLAAEARRVGRERDWQPRGIEHFVAVEICDRDFGGGNEPEILFAVRHAEGIGAELRQLPRSVHRIGIHQVRRKNFGVPVLAGVQIEHEIGERTFEFGAQVPVDGEARAGEFHGALQVENAEFGAEFPVRLGSEIEFRRRAPAAGFDIVVGAVADGHTRVRKIRDAGENIAQSVIEIGRRFFQRLNLLAQFLGLGHGRACILAGLLELGNLFGCLVALGFSRFGFSDGVAALGVDLAKIFEHGSRVHATLAQLFLDQRQVLAYEIQIKHGNSILYRKSGEDCTRPAESGVQTKMAVNVPRYFCGASDCKYATIASASG